MVKTLIESADARTIAYEIATATFRDERAFMPWVKGGYKRNDFSITGLILSCRQQRRKRKPKASR